MIRHIVLYEFKEAYEGNTKEANIHTAKEKFMSMIGVIPEIVNLNVADNVNDVDERNSDLILIIDFKSMEDLSNYKANNAHKKVSEFIRSVIKKRACVDFTV